METYEFRPSARRNPLTHARHRREVFWQITFPLLIGVIFILALGVLAGVMGGTGDHSRWADISLIWLVLLALAASFIFLLVLVGLTYGLFSLIQVLPGGFCKAQDFFVLVSVRVGGLGDRLVEPLLRVKTWRASAGRLKSELSGRIRRVESEGEKARDE